MGKISESTTVSIGVLIALIGGAAYVTFVAFQGTANAVAIQELKASQSHIDEIQTDIAVIKTKLERIEKKFDQ